MLGKPVHLVTLSFIVLNHKNEHNKIDKMISSPSPLRKLISNTNIMFNTIAAICQMPIRTWLV